MAGVLGGIRRRARGAELFSSADDRGDAGRTRPSSRASRGRGVRTPSPSYAWFASDSQIATGQKFVPPAGYVNYVIHCRETATDASGATTAADSAPVQIGKGVTSLSLKGTRRRRRRSWS